MLPTLRDGQVAILDKLSYHWRSPQRGDLVCVWTGQELYSKRIVGLPGEKIAIRDGALYVNDQTLAEPYIEARYHWNVGAGQIGSRSYVVIGDNRLLAQSQAVLAVVHRDRIVGRLIRFP
jgi:signal peptidase I